MIKGALQHLRRREKIESSLLVPAHEDGRIDEILGQNLIPF
jgi:hypothetical protein